MIFGEKSTEASVTKDSLVATFHKANPPLVWKFDLERNHSFTLALQGEEGDWELGLTSPKGDFYPITHFLTREDADEAFREVHKALGKRKISYIWFLAKLIFGLILLAIFLMFLTFFMPALSKLHSNRVPADFHGMTMQQMPQGMPMPADAYLKAPPVIRPALPGGTLPLPPGTPGLLETPMPAPESEMPLGVPLPADDVLKAPH